MIGKSFSLDPLKEEQIAYLVTINNIETWHKRQRQFHPVAMLNMKRKELVQRLSYLEFLLSYKVC